MEIIQEKESRAGLIGTIVFHAILLLCIIFFGMTYQDPPPINESAMLIDFGNAGGGSSSSQESESENASENEASTNDLSATENVEANAPENVETQNTTETVEVNAAANNSSAETTEPEQVVSDNLSNVMNALNNANNTSENSSENDGANDGSSTGNGAGEGDGNGPGEGPGWELGGGRGKVSLTTPKNPTQEDGTVVVDIVVNSQGKVIKATPGSRGSTTTNATLYKMAKEAALKALFTVKAGANDQKGTMTFVFILN